MRKFFSFLQKNNKLIMQFIMVFAAFLITIVISYYYSSNIIRKNIASYGQEVVSASAETINSYLNNFVTTLENLCFSIERLHAKNAGIEAMRQELEEWTKMMHSRQKNIKKSISFFGNIYNTFIDGNGWVPPGDYVSQSRPWYTGAYAHNGSVYFTEPYLNMETGVYSISVSRLVFDENKTPFGVIATDVFLSGVAEYVENMNFLGNGYGILLDSEQRFAVHPNDGLIGGYLASVNDGMGGFIEMSSRLAAGEELSAYQFVSYTGVDSIAFFKRLFNNWYLSIILPTDAYYNDIIDMRFIMSVAGIILAMLLCSVLAYMHVMVHRSNEASRVKSSFLANMSHEIRTPMNAIIGMTEYLQHEKLSMRQMDFVDDINTSARSLLSIINDILDMSKIEAGKLSLVPVHYDFYLFLDNIKSILKYMTDKKGLGFKLDTPGEIPRYLYGDDIRLRQIITNVGGNAVKFTGRGFINLRIFAENEKLIFEIEDTGRGIKKDDIQKIFNAFEQVDTKGNRAFIGTGLGLNISKTYAEMMGGKITVESEYGQGSTFTIEIPIVIGNEKEVFEVQDAQKEQVLSAPEANLLVVDDNELNLKTAVSLLGLFDVNVKHAYSGYEAIKIVKQQDFDIIFMDHMMPEMDGIEAANEIRKIKHNNPVIIALTANAVYGAKEMFLANGFNDFISKPIEMRDLKNLLIKWLPKEKIILTEQSEKSQSASELEFQRTLQRLFVKTNRNKYKEINTALETGDIVLAHRLAHTLKGNAGQIGKTQLQSAAADVERYLKYGKNHATEEQLKALETELNAVLDELSRLHLDSSPENTQSGRKLSPQVIKELWDKLEPLLKNGNPECLEFVGDLRTIPGTNQLVQQIEDFEFESAFQTFSELKKMI